MSNFVVLKPRISEKAYAMSEATNTYVFDVPTDANKHAIADAVVAQYKVEVSAVRIAAVPGKAKRAYRKRGRYIKAQRTNIRKAYVTLSEGHKLPLFNSAEEEPAKETK